MIANINHHIYWKACRPLKHKYNLTVNCILTLNGMFIWCKYVKPYFTWHGIYDFVRYFNTTDTAKYLTVLLTNGFVDLVKQTGNRKYYTISSKGISVISELNDSMSKEFSLFIDKYNIKL